jgi:hypothetical protein
VLAAPASESTKPTALLSALNSLYIWRWGRRIPVHVIPARGCRKNRERKLNSKGVDDGKWKTAARAEADSPHHFAIVQEWKASISHSLTPSLSIFCGHISHSRPKFITAPPLIPPSKTLLITNKSDLSKTQSLSFFSCSRRRLTRSFFCQSLFCFFF